MRWRFITFSHCSKDGPGGIEWKKIQILFRPVTCCWMELVCAVEGKKELEVNQLCDTTGSSGMESTLDEVWWPLIQTLLGSWIDNCPHTAFDFHLFYHLVQVHPRMDVTARLQEKSWSMSTKPIKVYSRSNVSYKHFKICSTWFSQ